MIGNTTTDPAAEYSVPITKRLRGDQSDEPYNPDQPMLLPAMGYPIQTTGDAAMMDMGGFPEGRQLRSRTRGGGMSGGRVTRQQSQQQQQHQQREKRPIPPNATTLCVMEVPPELNTIEHLKEHFGKFGTVTGVVIKLDQKYSFVTMQTHEQAVAALESPDAVLGNRFVRLNWAYRQGHENRTVPTDATDLTQVFLFRYSDSLCAESEKNSPNRGLSTAPVWTERGSTSSECSSSHRSSASEPPCSASTNICSSVSTCTAGGDGEEGAGIASAEAEINHGATGAAA